MRLRALLGWSLGWICSGWLAAPACAAPSCPPPVVASAADSAASAKDMGFLWRVTRDGHSSYLFGTLHVGKPAWRHMGPRLRAALQDSELLALEIDPSDTSLADGLRAAAPPLPLPSSMATRLAQAYERACVSASPWADLHPVLQASTLAVLEARWLGLDPAFAQEQLLWAQAQARGQPVVALESAAQQVAALVPAEPAQALALLAQHLNQLESQVGRRVMRRLMWAWQQGDLASLENFAEWCECANSAADKRAMRQLNDERNPGLADGISAHHAQGLRVFAAVGALHMTGPQSLPRLLVQRGFSVERVKLRP